MDICLSNASPTGCGHRTLTIRVDGVDVVLEGQHDADLAPLTSAEVETFVRLCVRRLKNEGVSLANFLNRVTYGKEATNVKQYPFFGPGAAVSKTNIGMAYVNILPGLNGERRLPDFTGCTEFRAVMHANLVGTGPFGLRFIRDSDSTILYENASIALTGERELDTGWLALPAPFVNGGEIAIRAQAKSTTATDDPVFRSLTLGVR